MIDELVLWRDYVFKKLITRMAYRTEYFISLAAMIITELAGPIFTYIIYTNSVGFSGWTFHQLLLLQGVQLAIKGLCMASFMGIMWNTNFKVWEGTFDFLLLKPRNSLWIFICDSFDTEDIAKFFAGATVTMYALVHLPTPAVGQILLFVLISCCAILFFLALAIFFSAFLFKVVQTWRIYEFLEILMMFGQYPKNMYSKTVGAILTGVIPVFIASFFPAEALLGRAHGDVVYAIIATVVLLIIAIKTWFAVIRNYASAGG